ncbi:hypothetical protein Psta_0340 [Pirellula staleyi DSM 6068]|uniref:Uncharacterized protein n=1 Tax=Pirellula staleyi (strain ATCC 27377 / DSM 6068 / ICPB 4128) TaxID=530564 RepID=D2R2C1_PIRSD|nr:hypothetical protein [Pirellula staleyi]ADB15030.1 hypothetical protein Psta_0340 [Pirellula staleyi DSM 6068]
MVNKAHTATARRIAARYNATFSPNGPYDIVGADITIEIETSATLAEGVERLQGAQGARYIAVTNKEAIVEAMRLTAGSGIGVMDPNGEIMKQAGNG